MKSQAKDQRRYVRFGALQYFIATSYSPDFPRTARLLISMWEENGGAHLDGVIGVETTKLDGAKDFTVIPAVHMLLQRDSDAMAYTLHFLKEGTFK